ncbi:putative inactive tRNA-specific adenosine deaminase-like protein 3 [Dorcoceras hygrometricum]|uniref:Putative inactive tRNA-specific adenosine deaminase-like protein 3 n=1 Tax=Dorcoceras hygrometricum TaxID=472368 RepID=A0A2Z7BXC1_9LAMI|nr:putative inactive tRNA-specific adenosine deaminase-like protein 3 [Dorcoceras hygrometricum]
MMNSRRICPAVGLQYKDSAVGLVFMESAAGLSLETSKVESVLFASSRKDPDARKADVAKHCNQAQNIQSTKISAEDEFSRCDKSAAKQLTIYESWMSTAERNSNGESDKTQSRCSEALQPGAKSVSGALLFKPTKELRFRSWTGLGVYPAVQPLKGQFPRGSGRSQAPSRQQGIQLAVGPQPLRLRNHNFGLAKRITVKRLATSPHDPLGITDSSCKNQLVVVSVQYGPFIIYIPIRSTTIGKSRVARDPIAMHASWRSKSDIASVTRTNQYNQDLGLIHSTNGNHLESPNEGSSIDHQVTIHLHAQNITMFPTNETWYFASQMIFSSSGGLILILTAQSTRNEFRIHSDY